MSNEPAFSEDFEQYDDADELRRLIRAVKFSQKHFLYFVCCNQVPKQNELIDAVKKEFKSKKIRVVKFKKPITDLLGELQKKKIAADCEAVFVQGLEYSIASDATGAGNALIHNLNISRDSFKKYLACPLFLWLPEYAIVKITRHAPDFFSVRSGTFYFSNPPEKVVEQIFESTSTNFTESSALPLIEKLKQIDSLENLLSEYRGLHQEKQDKQAEVQLSLKLADFFYSISKYQEAIKYYKQALEIAREINDRLGIGVSLGNLGLIYFNLADYPKAIKYHEESLDIARNTDNRDGESSSLGNLGNIYLNLGNYPKAIEYQLKSLAIAQEIGNRLSAGYSLGNLGVSYYNLGDYQKAIEYHEQSLIIKREIADKQGESNSLTNLGTAYNNLGEYQEANNYYEQSLKIALKTGNQLAENIILGNLGNNYNNMGEYQKAVEYLERALSISRSIGDRYSEGRHLNNLGIVYNNFGERERACSLWKESLIICETIKSPTADVARQLIEANCGS